jgi:ribonuclease J
MRERVPVIPCIVTYTRIVPLGGLGEVGMNCLAIETPEGLLVVDCGVTFPQDDRGGDIIHPNFSYLWDRRDSVLGVVVTHGHEDHIGGLPYLLRRIPVPVYAPPYAAALIRHRLAEHAEVPVPDVRTTSPRARFELGPFGIEPLRVTHSIPDSTALAIDTPAGRIFHTGDFKLESEPLDGQESDEERFRELGIDGVAVLLSDSTNVDVPGRAGRERDVAAKLYDLVRTLPRRVVIGAFASNVFRLQSIMEVAAQTERKVCLLGRSVQTHVRAASDLGRLKFRSDLLVPPEFAMTIPPRNLIAIATGTQAEPQSALAKLSRGEHPTLKLDRGDAVILSSRTIPGSERPVFDMICRLERRGVDVHFRATDGDLHVSGHAAREEQARMIELIRPRSFVPVHGTFHHLQRHANLAREVGVHDVQVIENGQTVRWANGALRESDRVSAGRVHVDGGVDLDDEVLAERRALGVAGVVTATIEIDSVGLLVRVVEVTTRGVVVDDPPDVVAESVRLAIHDALVQARGVMVSLPVESAREVVRRTLRRMYRVGMRKPLTVVHVISGLDLAPRPPRPVGSTR